MQETKTFETNKKIALLSVQFVLFVAIVTIAPMIKQQFIVGPLVNATLFISAATLGTAGAIMIGLIPSVISLSTGLLPAVLAPVIPFIMISNAILVLVFAGLKKRNFFLGVVSASVLKYLFLYATSSVVISLILKKEVAKQVVLMMSWPQLVTALIGGVIAYSFLRVLRHKTAYED
ncbi:MAG: [Fe] hydrogenase subunit HymD [Candidatus Berkelbacteria bacterium Athens1014_28]|uniref:[Fe] hydrogenase subunit HymD n=1 Tax=Candidatus Berkelbacteria bacterium Athens1014_28 TaxID=2017145 RepID=A0A554LLB4_9BACT|nr:MAG: [Fe] hydrogenase subunit HymD [Candidatus Berkelbacteria bacterium Athens1014_28]